MKKILFLAAFVLAATPAFAQLYNNQRAQPSGYGMYGNDQQVNGYSRSNGTHVEPYHRTEADSNPYNNYSAQGNVNPYTGQAGHKSPGY